MTDINELENEANQSWGIALDNKKVADKHRLVGSSGAYKLTAIYYQNKALYYQNQIILANQENILKHIKTK